MSSIWAPITFWQKLETQILYAHKNIHCKILREVNCLFWEGVKAFSRTA